MSQIGGSMRVTRATTVPDNSRVAREESSPSPIYVEVWDDNFEHISQVLLDDSEDPGPDRLF
jgi:hypothetical protein